MIIHRTAPTSSPPPQPWFSFAGDLANEEEIRITAPFTVRLVPSKPIPMSATAIRNTLPDRPGIYFIYKKDPKNNSPQLHYVGKSESSIRRRFEDRLKAFADFGLNAPDYDPLLARSQVICIEVKPEGTLSNQGVSRGPKGGTHKPKHTLPGLIAAVEQYYLRKFKRSNQSSEAVIFAPSGSLRLLMQSSNGAAWPMDYFDAKKPL